MANKEVTVEDEMTFAKKNITVHLPESGDAQLIVAASITQAAATIYAAGRGEMEESAAIDKALILYAGVLERLRWKS